MSRRSKKITEVDFSIDSVKETKDTKQPTIITEAKRQPRKSAQNTQDTQKANNSIVRNKLEMIIDMLNDIGESDGEIVLRRNIPIAVKHLKEAVLLL